MRSYHTPSAILKNDALSTKLFEVKMKTGLLTLAKYIPEVTHANINFLDTLRVHVCTS